MFSYSLYVVCCLYVTFLLPPERATKAGPCHLFFYVLNQRIPEFDFIEKQVAGAGFGGPL